MEMVDKLLPIDISVVGYQQFKRDYNLKDPTTTRICQFAGWIRRHYGDEEYLTQDMLDDWAIQNKSEAWNSYCNRISAIRSFLGFWEKRGYGPYEIPDAKKRKEYPVYTHMEKEDVARFFQNVDAMSDARYMEAQKYEEGSYRYRQNMVSALAIPVYSRLLYSSGMRCTEVRLLRRDSVNLSDGIIHIHTSETKGYTERFVAIHDSLIPLMREYDARVQMIVLEREFFFVNACGRNLSKWWYSHLFRVCWPGDPTIVQTGFRHNFAIENLIRMDDATSQLEMYTLSKAMGHTSLKRTKYYLHLTPAFFALLVSPKTSLNLTYGNEKE